MSDDKRSGWARLFSKRKDLVEGDDFVGRLLEGLARIVEVGGDPAETLREVRAQVVDVFHCEDISIFVADPDERPKPEEGEWVLKVKAGFGKGNRVSQADSRAVPALVPGKRLIASEFLTERAVLKTIALAYEEGSFYGCDIENKKVLLMKDPKPEDDLGSGDFSLLAIPLHHHNRLGRVVETTRVGVLALYKVPAQRDLTEVEGPVRALVAHAVVGSQCTLKDPVTGMFTEAFLKEELGRQLNLVALTKGKLQGGVVVGWIDALHIYKQTLESQAAVDPQQVSRLVSTVVRGVAGCVWKRCEEHTLGPGIEYACGYPGRVGHEGFAVLLPRLSPTELCTWAQRLAKDVVGKPFEGEEHLPCGDVTVSLRIVPFGSKGTHAKRDCWKLVTTALEEIDKDQHKAKGAGALKGACASLLVLNADGAWVKPSDLRTSTEPDPKVQAASRGPTEIDGIGLVDEVPTGPAPAKRPPPKPKAPPAKGPPVKGKAARR
jgi:GGDEF domain-containing protein